MDVFLSTFLPILQNMRKVLKIVLGVSFKLYTSLSLNLFLTIDTLDDKYLYNTFISYKIPKFLIFNNFFKFYQFFTSTLKTQCILKKWFLQFSRHEVSGRKHKITDCVVISLAASKCMAHVVAQVNNIIYDFYVSLFSIFMIIRPAKSNLKRDVCWESFLWKLVR